MESDLEVLPTNPTRILQLVLRLASWANAHRNEILGLIRQGWTNAQAIVNYLKKKYKIK